MKRNIRKILVLTIIIAYFAGYMLLLYLWSTVIPFTELDDTPDYLSSVDWQSTEALRIDGQEYQYTVDDREYTNDRYHFYRRVGGNSIDEDYPVGSIFTIYYDPENPDNAVVEPDPSLLSMLYLAARCLLWFGVLIVGGLFLRVVELGPLKSFIARISKEDEA